MHWWAFVWYTVQTLLLLWFKFFCILLFKLLAQSLDWHFHLWNKIVVFFYVVLTKEQSVLTKIMRSFERKSMQTQYNVLGYRIDLYFHDYKFAIQIDENGHNERILSITNKQNKNLNKKTKSNKIKTWL